MHADSLTSASIYDKAMVWCGERFISSKDAIRVSDKSSGIISGKAHFSFSYMVPKKKDSAIGIVYSPFEFNWIMEVKDGRLRFKATEIEYVSSVTYDRTDKYPVYISGKSPVDIFMLMASAKVQLQWDMARKYFIIRLDQLLDDLHGRLKKEDIW